jgi:hypothetical protein
LYEPGSPSAASRLGLSGFVAVLGGSQKDENGGSKIPAPGTMMSTRPNDDRPLLKREDNCGHEVTSVGWKIAEGPDPLLS